MDFGCSWRTSSFRENYQLHLYNLSASGVLPPFPDPVEVEQSIFGKSSSKEEYLSLMDDLIAKAWDERMRSVGEEQLSVTSRGRLNSIPLPCRYFPVLPPTPTTAAPSPSWLPSFQQSAPSIPSSSPLVFGAWGTVLSPQGYPATVPTSPLQSYRPIRGRRSEMSPVPPAPTLDWSISGSEEAVQKKIAAMQQYIEPLRSAIDFHQKNGSNSTKLQILLDALLGQRTVSLEVLQKCELALARAMQDSEGKTVERTKEVKEEEEEEEEEVVVLGDVIVIDDEEEEDGSKMEEHPLVQQLRRQVAGLRKRVDEMVDQYLCQICLERKCDLAFQCGHMSCSSCGCLGSLSCCHLCRQPIFHRQRLFPEWR